jgi:EAL domain-containing protein (putative c-di-GMP-specific phosphodiesterase class I)
VKSVIAEKLLEMGAALGIGTIVEGVENEAELRWVRDHGANYVQGFLLGMPQPAVRP